MPAQQIKKGILALLLLGVLTSPLLRVVSAAEKTSSDRPHREATVLEAFDHRSTDNLGSWLARLFRDHVSRVDGDRCPSVPSCSAYSFQAFKKHGFFMGWLMTVDRLIHEGSEEAAVSPLVHRDGRMKIFDPLENNDFWWYRKEPEGYE